MSPITTVPPHVLDHRRRVAEAAVYLRERSAVAPRVGLILGSGLGALGEGVEGAVRLSFGEIPHFPVATAPGHQGVLVLGHLEGQPVAVMQGRVHLYEGHAAQAVAFPVRVMKALGIDTLIVTCATGGLNFRFRAGDLMLIQDHINLMGVNPLVGPNDPELGERFPVMYGAYRPELIQLAKEVAISQGTLVQEGVYAAIPGPAFLTKAELRYLTRIGADSVGMSTVPEVVAAVHAGLRVLGIATVSDMAIPDAGHHASETEILDVARRVGPTLERLVRGVLARL
ncbi:MAG: purine-nucleoside phosphorylase [Candidatus Sericytochromatia bacterium]|nr:purine-nucleoside phosphorylase [Candidatus Sericytochromatia bacterium]